MPPTAVAAPAPAAGRDAAAAGDPAAPAARPNPLGGLVRMFFMWYLARSLFGGGGSTPTAKLPRESQLWPALARGTPVDLAFFLTEADAPPTDWAAAGGPIWSLAGVPLGAERAERNFVYEYTPSDVRGQGGGGGGVAVLVVGGRSVAPGGGGAGAGHQCVHTHTHTHTKTPLRPGRARAPILPPNPTLTPRLPLPLIPSHTLQAVQRNASLYLHTLLAPAGTPLDPAAPGYDPTAVHARTWRANAHLPRPKNKTGVLLLDGGSKDGKAGGGGGAVATDTPGRSLAGFGGATDSGGADSAAAAADAAKAPQPPREVISYLKPNLTVALIDEFSAFPANAVPPHVSVCVGGESGREGRAWARRERGGGAQRQPSLPHPSHPLPSPILVSLSLSLSPALPCPHPPPPSLPRPSSPASTRTSSPSTWPP